MFRCALICCLIIGHVSTVGALTRGHVVDQSMFLARFPWAVVVERPDSGRLCTGVLISPTWVATAAHCTGPDRSVRIGNTLRAETRVIDVRAAIRHPRYRPGRLWFDIGLLQLARPVDLPPLPLISRGEHILLVADNAPATIAGWGRYRGSREYAARLMTAEIELKNLAEQATFLVFSAASGPCGGDSGGPLTVTGLDREPVLAGIASATNQGDCKQEDGSSAYTNISIMLDFITGHVLDLPD